MNDDPNAPLLPPRRGDAPQPEPAAPSAAPIARSQPPVATPVATTTEPRGWPFWPVPVFLLLVLSGVVWLRPPRFVRPVLASGRAEARIEPYVGQLLFEATRPAAVVGAPYVCGKVAVIDAKARRVDESFHGLDPAIRADDASQIGTLARVSCGEVALGTFAGTKTANTHAVRCRVELVDYRTRAWIGALPIDSEDLPAPMRRTGEVHGSRPDRAIARWISSLPRTCAPAS